MKKCSVCGKHFNLKKEERHEVHKQEFIRLVKRSVAYEYFDCPYCGCQNIVNIRDIGESE